MGDERSGDAISREVSNLFKEDINDNFEAKIDDNIQNERVEKEDQIIEENKHEEFPPVSFTPSK